MLQTSLWLLQRTLTANRSLKPATNRSWCALGAPLLKAQKGWDKGRFDHQKLHLLNWTSYRACVLMLVISKTCLLKVEQGHLLMSFWHNYCYLQLGSPWSEAVAWLNL